LPFGDCFFEIITAHELIEHLKAPEKFLEEAYRVLKPNGLLFITTPNVSSLFNSRAVKGVYKSLKYSTPFDDETHVSYFDSELITKTLKHHKFSKVKIKYSWNSERINLYLTRRLGWTLQAFAYR
jgi:2-polyprenyl-3-methyl-5-hydroxy-6-metoxy-1,4-benzoquinol methylase